jgi:hypothetical protein
VPHQFATYKAELPPPPFSSRRRAGVEVKGLAASFEL